VRPSNRWATAPTDSEPGATFEVHRIVRGSVLLFVLSATLQSSRFESLYFKVGCSGLEIKNL
jgi:hypothetical protein